MRSYIKMVSRCVYTLKLSSLSMFMTGAACGTRELVAPHLT